MSSRLGRQEKTDREYVPSDPPIELLGELV